MARELQPDIFGDLRPTEVLSEPSMALRLPWSSAGERTQQPMPQQASFMREEDWRTLVGQVDQLKKRMSEVESSQMQVQNRQNELIQATKVRIERVMGSCQRMDEIVKNFTTELSDKMSAMQLRLNERKLADHKVQELVDRRASMLQTYEVRLGALQKLLSEQEMLLMNARAALQEARRRS